MKTINPSIQIFTSLESATKAFDKCTSGDLLYSKAYKSWYVDFSKSAANEWPTLYTIISTK